MPNKVTTIVIALLLAHSLPALFQGPMLLFRRIPSEKTGPSTKALEDTFNRLPALPPPSAVVVPTQTDKVDSPSIVSSVRPENTPPPGQKLETADDISRLFESQPETASPTVSPAGVSLPSNSPEVPIGPAR